MRHTLPILTLLAISLPDAVADDLFPPPWERFTPGTVFAEWTFGEDHGGEAGYWSWVLGFETPVHRYTFTVRRHFLKVNRSTDSGERCEASVVQNLQSKIQNVVYSDIR